MKSTISKHQLDKLVNGRTVERHWNEGCILCSSAVQSTQPASKSGGAYRCVDCGLTFSTSSREQNNLTHFIVQDSWDGLSDEDREKLYEIL